MYKNYTERNIIMKSEYPLERKRDKMFVMQQGLHPTVIDCSSGCISQKPQSIFNLTGKKKKAGKKAS